MKKLVVLLVVLSWLSLSCATGNEAYVRAGSYSPNETSWWGSDPTCSPGCPPGQGGW
jgi:hypothetical protein